MSDFFAWAWSPDWVIGLVASAALAAGFTTFAAIELLVDWRAKRRDGRRKKDGG